MAEHLKAYGWEYIVLDIQWYEPGSDGKNGRPYDYPRNPQTCLDEWGRVWPAANKHPSSVDGRGLRPLADYVHGLGLKFGLHMMRGIPRRGGGEEFAGQGDAIFCGGYRQPEQYLSVESGYVRGGYEQAGGAGVLRFDL